MKIITVGTDTKVFEKGRVYERIREYSQSENIEKYYFLVFTRDSKAQKIIDNNFIVIPVHYKHKLLFFFALWSAIRKEKIENNRDVVISAQDPFEIGFFTYLISKIFKYRFLVQVHTDISSKYFRRESVRNYCQFLLSKFVIKKANAVRVVSDKIRKYVVGKLGVHSSKVYLAPIFAGDLSVEKVESVNRANIILVMSRLEKVKNIPLAIKSFLELVKDKKYQDYKLKIVGSGTQEKYLKEKWGNNENIIFEKFTDNPAQEYGNAKLFLLTSWYEGWGMTPIESVSCGTPVVMTNVGCANEFVFDNLNGYISPTFKFRDFTEAMKKVLDQYDNFTQDKLSGSLKMLQTKQEYLKTQLDAFLKCLG